MKVWRNSEGREFPAGDFGWAHLERMLDIPGDAMRELGYELVEGLPTLGKLREAQRNAWEEGTWAVKRDGSVRPNPYDPPSEPKEFEGFCSTVLDARALWPDDAPCIVHVQLIPGKSYWVREVVR